MADAALSEQEAQQLARQYYATQGEWAGKFTITRFLKSRVELSQSDVAKLHFQYEWAFIKDPGHTGIDNRYFVYRNAGNGWRVIEMGAHQSGRP